ncbi:MAG: aspartate kinase [Bacteroidales bacterium]|jgi:aspartate kinase|nr:aspartate kinase [Bacteroidales bacterium]
MKVFKFGGASVKDAGSVRTIPGILEHYREDEIVVIISAMGKTTNALESLTLSAWEMDGATDEIYAKLYAYHLNIVRDLFPDEKHAIYPKLNEFFNSIKSWLGVLSVPEREYSYDLYYDQIVSAGELLSTAIISQFLNEHSFGNTWLDARELVITDDTYRAGRVNWEKTIERIRDHVRGKLCITQGFIGGNGKFAITLGREGSDFSAAIFANALDADELIVWKDVPGYLNADPKYFADTVKLDRISYTESIELAFYGAKIIHPKTIRPLKNKNIPLKVKSFLNPLSEGSLIHENGESDARVPSCIIKEDQVLLSISARDFSFIAENNLHQIFGFFVRHRCGINLMQNSAISFSVCLDDNERLEGLIADLQHDFKVKYNKGLRLVTIRHYDQGTIDKLTSGKDILLEQKSRTTAQFVIK